MCESTVNADTGSDGPAMRSGQVDANGNPMARRVFKTACIYSSFLAMVRELEFVNTFRVSYLYGTDNQRCTGRGLIGGKGGSGSGWGRHGDHTIVAHGGQQRGQGPCPCRIEGARGRWQPYRQTDRQKHTHTHTMRLLYDDGIDDVAHVSLMS